MKSSRFTRRQFIKMSAAATAGISLTYPRISRSQKSSTPGEVLKLGVIGTGDRGEWLVYIAQNQPGLQVIACCDILPDHLQAGLKAAAPKAKGYDDYRKLLENKELDAVIIATPLYLHFEMAKDTLAAGKHVFLEKTMTYTIPQALELEKIVTSSDKVFQVGYQSRNHPLYQEIREMISNGYCGEIKHVRCNYHRNGNWRRQVADPKLERLINWRMYWEYSAGLMGELCSHHIDVTNWMLDSHPLRVTGMGGIDFWKDGRETFDNVHAIYEYPKGVKAIFSSITTNAHYGISLQYMGTLGTIEITKEEGQEARFYPEQKLLAQEQQEKTEKGVYAVTAATYQAWKKGEGTVIEIDNPPAGDEQTSGIALRDFADCIRNKKKPVSNVQTGRRSTIAVHLGNTAMRQGTVEQWKPEYLD